MRGPEARPRDRLGDPAPATARRSRCSTAATGNAAPALAQRFAADRRAMIRQDDVAARDAHVVDELPAMGLVGLRRDQKGNGNASSSPQKISLISGRSSRSVSG